ncbi:acetylserotonin O-methyltransferase [Actinomadura sp. ATCC 31491]|uniref:Acetylserotonin O-methyltransferase n=1 Tax=Actinomadura luzonensis TaxID=2805427 RepID=A0ABT0GAB0_9ACTN|nr:acetylserotonin O-methyltransferase [Actinomadura luzonensis]MCK2221544.1 acetylserotonin O-methyltransferase [Actinomadura luzonensis]
MPHSDELLWGAVGDISRLAALLTMAELGVADHLADGPLGTAELARRCGADAAALRRVLRELAAMDLVRAAGGDSWDLAPRGTALRSDVPDSVRSSIRMLGEESFWTAMGLLPATVREGSSAFVKRYGHLYDHLAADPAVSAMFDDYMRRRALPFTEGLVKAYAFPPTATMVDVAGGKGHILASVLHANPRMRGILLDLPHVTPQAERTFAEEGLSGRAEVVAGDIFAEVPAGGDVYLLASVLHNWDDADAVTVLGNVRRAMHPAGRVLVLEAVLPDDAAPHLGKDIDLRMLAIFNGGAERTREEYAALLRRADLALADVVELGSGASLIEAVPR